MKISFLVTSHNEGQQLFKLLYILNEYLLHNTEDEVILLDDYSDDKETVDTIKYFSTIKNNFVYYHKLEKDYSTHKNYGVSKCTGDYIFALDADETPHPELLANLKAFLEINPSVDLFHVPRVNIVHNLTPEYVALFQWRVTPVPGFDLVPIINFPDYQTRLWKRNDTIKWERKLHEHIVGSDVVTKFPAVPEYSIVHEKTLDKQIKQNEHYNTNFSMHDNIRIL